MKEKIIYEHMRGWDTVDELEFLYNTAKGKQVVVEIGSAQGRGTIALAKGTEGIVYAIDPYCVEDYGEGRLNLFKKNLKIADVHNVEIITEYSQNVEWSKPIDFIFIDGDHSYKGAKSDFNLYSWHIVEGGIIAFHDAVPNFQTFLTNAPLLGVEGVKKTVKEDIFGSRNYKNIGMVGNILYATKCTNNSMLDRIGNTFSYSHFLFKYFILAVYSSLRKVPTPVRHFIKRQFI